MAKLDAIMSGGDSSATYASREAAPRSGGITVNGPLVSMTIQTNNADGFKASQDQIAREMQKGLDRAIRTIGRSSDIDDPTRRT